MAWPTPETTHDTDPANHCVKVLKKALDAASVLQATGFVTQLSTLISAPKVPCERRN
jgi:hypothetical protein